MSNLLTITINRDHLRNLFLFYLFDDLLLFCIWFYLVIRIIVNLFWSSCLFFNIYYGMFYLRNFIYLYRVLYIFSIIILFLRFYNFFYRLVQHYLKIIIRLISCLFLFFFSINLCFKNIISFHHFLCWMIRS